MALMLAACFGVTGCATIYHPPADLTPQNGASLTGIYHPGGLLKTGTHICLASIDGMNLRYPFGEVCDRPVLIPPGTHTISISADFHPFPAENGFTTVIATFQPGQTYFIRANGGPVPFTNTNGAHSLPASGLTVWIESASGVLIVNKTMVELQAPPEVIPVLIFSK